jgi:hypothetical protein
MIMKDHNQSSSSDADGSADTLGSAFHQELERRLTILAPEGRDVTPLGKFNRFDYLLMVLLGLVLPILAMFWGWH